MTSTTQEGESTEPTLNHALHVRYFLRCLKTFLPTGYQEQDSSRVVLAFFILTALDLLDGLEAHIKVQERSDYIDFIYRCQHPLGGFRSFPGTDLGSAHSSATNPQYDPANIAGTYFALASLAILGDDLSRVQRHETLAWLRHLQHPDGSFGDLAAGPDGKVDGGQDVRFCFLAALVCAILGEEGNTAANIERHIDVSSLTHFLFESQTYDGGIGRNPHGESHAGSTYCAVATLQLLGLLPLKGSSTEIKATGPISLEFQTNLVHWLAQRQTTMLYDYRDTDILDEEDFETESNSDGDDVPPPSFTVLNATPKLPPLVLAFEKPPAHEGNTTAGLNGRTNKPADTCYSFWTGASLSILDCNDLLDTAADRRYLLSQTQHRIGGFAKFPDMPPDILHSALALACLAGRGESGLKPIDPIFCVSLEVKKKLDAVPWRQST